MPYTYENQQLTETDATLADTVQPHLIVSTYILSSNPARYAETQAQLANIASAALNIEIAHTIEQIVNGTYYGSALYIHAPDVAPHTDGFYRISFAEYCADLYSYADEPGPIALLCQHMRGSKLAVHVIQLN